jgi:prepilin-type processing-associated H-X9-DG protein
MRMRFRRLISTTLLCLFALVAMTAMPATVRADINRFINEQTILAAEADLTKLDAAAIEGMLIALGKAAGVVGANPMQMTEPQAKVELAKGTTWVNDVKKAGATSIDLVMDSVGGHRYGPAIIIPVADAQAPAIAKLIPIPAQPPGRRPGGPHMTQVVTIPGVGVVFGAGANVNMIKALKPAPRADLATAFKTAGAAPIKLAFALDAKMRDDIAKNAPPMILGKPTTLVTKDFQWASGAMTPPPGTSIKVIAQSTDAATAKASDELIVSAIVMNQQGRSKLPDQLITLLTPQVQGSQLVLALDAKQLNQVAVAMREPLMRARQTAMRVQSASNIRQMLQACLLHANENKGQYPADLKALEAAMAKFMPEPAMVKRIMTNPAKPEIQPAYVYIKPAKGNAAPAETVVIYESHKDFGDGINVGFADGHVEFVGQKQQFDQALAKTAQQ